MGAASPSKGIYIREERVRRPGAARRVVLALALLTAMGAVTAVTLIVVSRRHPRLVLRTYEYAVVSRKDISDVLQLTGLVDYATTWTLRAPESGTVAEVGVRAGDTVYRGQVLARLESPQTVRRLNENRALLERKRRERQRKLVDRDLQVARDERALAAAETRERRATEALADAQALHDVGAVTGAEVDAARDTLLAATDALAELKDTMAASAALHGLALADVDQDIQQAFDAVERDTAVMEALAVRSPIAGRVIEILAGPGAVVDTLGGIVVVVDTSVPVVRLDVSESRVRQIAIGQAVSIVIGDAVYEGRIQAIDARAMGGSATISSTVAVTAGFVEAPKDLLPGVSAKTVVTLGTRRGALTLPRGPFLTTGGGSLVYVVDGNQAVRTVVAVGVQSATDVEIERGLEEGDVVIVSSYTDLMGYERFQVEPTGGTRR